MIGHSINNTELQKQGTRPVVRAGMTEVVKIVPAQRVHCSDFVLCSLQRSRSRRSATSTNDAQIRSWFKDAHDNSNTNPVVVLVGNKTDLAEQAAVTDKEVEELARELGGVQTFKCSAKDGSGVDAVFTALSEAVINKVNSTGYEPADDSVFENTSDVLNSK